ncbi:MAG: enoyl-CoA hydratase-related protein, partial [Planctomycetota bacterium]
GSGAALVLASDLVVAGGNATLAVPNPRLGLVAGAVAPLLAYRLGAGPAARLLLASPTVDASEAHRLGLFHELAEDHLLWARASELGRQCAAGAPEAVALTKRLLLETAGEGLATQLASGAIATAASRTTEAADEGIEAFLAKRDPTWQ